MNPNDAIQLQQVRDNTVGNKNSHAAGAWGEGGLTITKENRTGFNLDGFFSP